MSQSRFSIVLVGVSALLRRPLVSRLRPADGERSSWVVFAARVGRFESGFRSVVGLRVHRFRFSARTASEIPLGGLVLPPSASEWPLGEFVLPPSVSELPLGGLAFGVTASAFRHAPLRSGCWASWFFRLPLRKLPSAGWPSGFRFRFSACAVSEIAFGGLVLPPSASEIALGGLAFGLTASAFRHAPIRTAAPPKRGPTEHNDTTTVSLQNTYPNMLTYHIVRRKHFKTGKLLYYPQLVTPVADDHMHIIERIEKKCTLASADVKAVVDALEVEIIDSLRQGRSVRLGDLGSFRPTLRCSAGVGLPELAGVGQIKRVHVVFHPSSRIRRALSVKDHAVSFVQRDKKKHGANAQQGGSPTGGGTPGAPAPSTGSSAAGSAVTPPGTPVPAPPSTGTPAGTPVPAAPSTTTSTPTGTPAAGSGTSAAGSAVTPPGTPVPATPSTGTPAGTPVPAAPSTGTPAGTPVPAAPSTGTPAVSGTPAAGGA